MRLLILSDVHSNLEALGSVLDDARRRGFDRAVCLGDLVGYGANPNEVVDVIRALDPIAIRGNHDKVIAGVENGEQFNVMAVQSCQWTRMTLTQDNLAYLGGLPQGPLRAEGDVWIAHGTPLDEDAYILNDFDAVEVFERFPHRICFFGHSHIPTLFSLDDDEGFYLVSPLEDEERMILKPGSRYLANCGSVGQPRDRNPKAAYGIYSTTTGILEFCRVAYAVSEAQRKIEETPLPRFLAERLAYGV